MTGEASTAADLLAHLPVAVIVLTATGGIVGANAAAEALLNTSVSALRGEGYRRALPLPPWCLARIDAGDAFVAYDVPLALRTVDVRLTPLGDGDGRRMLTLSPRSTDAFAGDAGRPDRGRAGVGAAAILAHEIKNPLSAIRGAAQLLEGAAGEREAPLLTLIRDEVDRIAALIDRMQPLSDARALARRAVNLHDVLEHARAVAQAAFGERLAIRDAYDPSLPPVLADRDTLVQLVLNLLQNAAEAAGEGGGAAVLRTRYHHGVSVGEGADRRRLPVELAVIDHGPGVPPELLPHLFEPFVSGKTQGRGLGLAIVDKLVRDTGGLVRYERDEQASRTVFRVLLERAPEERE